MSTIVHYLRRLDPLVLSAGALVVFAGCASVTPIGELLDNASRYNGKTVRIEALFTLGTTSLAVLHEQSRSAP